jgi:hypothetical protein
MYRYLAEDFSLLVRLRFYRCRMIRGQLRVLH